MRSSSAPLSNRPPSSSYSAGILGLLLSAGLTSLSCGGGEYTLLVRINGAPIDTQALTVSAKLDGKQAMTMDLPTEPAYFGIRLPEGSSGKLEVTVAALGSDQCKSASGVVTIDLAEGRAQEKAVTLGALTPRLCSLYYQSSGEGELVVTPPGMSCGTGCMDYAAGAMVTATFNPNGKSIGTQVSLNATAICDGVSPCAFSVSRRTNLAANFMPRVCTANKWCWYNPLPQGNTIQSISGTSATDIWATGLAGTLLHYDGQTWSPVASGTQNHLVGVWARAANDAWAVGENGTILRYDGAKWSASTSNTTSNLRSVWGSAENNIWAVGATGTVLHNTGSGWTASPISGVTTGLNRVTGSSATNVWTVGSGGAVARFDGTSWTAMSITGATAANLQDAWAVGTNEVWVVGLSSGNGSCINARYNGSAWSLATSCTGSSNIWGNGVKDVWTLGPLLSQSQRNTTGDITQPVAQSILPSGMYPGFSNPAPTALWGATPGEVWIGTAEGNLIRRNGDTQTTILTAPPSYGGNFYALAGTGTANDLFVARLDGVVYRYDGRKLNPLPIAGAPSMSYDAWAAPTGELFLASTNGYVYRFSGNAWSMDNNTLTSSSAFAIGGTAANDYYTGTAAGFIYRFNGSFYTRISPTTAYPPLQALWCRGPSDCWAAGGSGFVARVTTASTTQQSVPAAGRALYAVNGPASGTHVWIVGELGTILHYNGTSWTSRSFSTTEDLFAVAAFNESDVWFGGTHGILLHWNGTQIEQVPSGIRGDIHKLWGSAATGLWMAADSGTLMRYQGP